MLTLFDITPIHWCSFNPIITIVDDNFFHSLHLRAVMLTVNFTQPKRNKYSKPNLIYSGPTNCHKSNCPRLAQRPGKATWPEVSPSICMQESKFLFKIYIYILKKKKSYSPLWIKRMSKINLIFPNWVPH